MQNVLMLKTPGGRSVGHARIDGAAGRYTIALTGEKKRSAHIIAVCAEECVRLVPDAQGGMCAPFRPDALVMLDETGMILAVGAQSGKSTEASIRAQRYVLNRVQRTAESVQAENAEQDAAQEAAASTVKPDENPSAADNAVAPTELTDGLKSAYAWPPPPFFPAAQFKDGAWVTQTDAPQRAF